MIKRMVGDVNHCLSYGLPIGAWELLMRISEVWTKPPKSKLRKIQRV